MKQSETGKRVIKWRASLHQPLSQHCDLFQNKLLVFEIFETSLAEMIVGFLQEGKHLECLHLPDIVIYDGIGNTRRAVSNTASS